MKISFIAMVFTASLTACAMSASPDAVPQAAASSMPQASQRFLINPATGLSATLFITSTAGGQVEVQVQDRPLQRLIGINPELFSTQAHRFFQLVDKNKDGYIDIGVLMSADTAANKYCYEWFIYESRLAYYREHNKYYFCQS